MYYQKALTTMNVVTMPVIACAIWSSHETVPLLLGPQWSDAAHIFRILAIAAFIAPAADTAGFLLVTSGQTARYLRLGAAIGVVLLLAFGIGVWWKALGVACGYLAATYVLFVVRLRYSFTGTPAHARRFLAAIRKPSLETVMMLLILDTFKGLRGDGDGPAVILTALPVALASYLLAWLVMPGGKHTVTAIVRGVVGALRLSSPLARPAGRQSNVGTL
jgi:hypothetical protein